METYNVTIPDISMCPGSLIDLPGTYGYLRRQPALADNWASLLKRRGDNCSRLMTCLLNEYEDRAISLKKYEPLKIRYITDLAGNTVDFFNKIEMFGGMQSSKENILIYTLYDKIDYAMAYIFNISLDTVRTRLIRNCKKCNIGYRLFSYAFSSGDASLLNEIDLNMFTDITDILDFELYSILNSAVYSYSVESRIISLDQRFSSDQKITIFFLTKFTNFYHRIINLILSLFYKHKPPFIQSNRLVPVSVGTDNLVISSEYPHALPDLRFDINNVGILELPLKTIDSLEGFNEDNWYSDVS